MFQLSYILHNHGWATVSIGNGERTINTEVSSLSDAVGDLARGARGILRGLPEALVRFEQEPGEHRMTVVREGGTVRVEVACWAETFSGKTSGESLLVAGCSVGEFATVCINCLRRVLDAHGEADYLRRWGTAFPMDTYRDLLDLRRDLNAVKGLDEASGEGSELEIRQFGAVHPGVDYVLRPGGYAVIRNGERQVAVVSAHRGYFLPGGGQDPGETPEQAAVREAFEECGLRIRLIGRLGVADQLVYASGEQTYFRKRCTFFAADGVQQEGEGEADHQLVWMPLDQAATLLSHESQRWAVAEAIRTIWR